MSRDKLNSILSARAKLAKALVIAQDLELPERVQKRILDAFAAVDACIKTKPTRATQEDESTDEAAETEVESAPF
jgi:hypothetical protein